jgi:putative FmdB family regulatory protein
VIKIPIYEYVCRACGYVDEEIEFGDEMNREHFCSQCNTLSDRKVSLSKFKLVYDNKTDMCSWGNEGYASSQYWNAYKKAKENGENVKPYGED